ncbi:unnamed protein product [Dovyalis caffra]|uniref:General transcription and DNA repair factor IIH subunit TFB5 n=1 Tax=Dovyalis caffra TaxID=77055 RepID=A0AAV1RSY6_9ROSI|nr:unnamed protein product [Dovyalis caffra]
MSFSSTSAGAQAGNSNCGVLGRKFKEINHDSVEDGMDNVYKVSVAGKIRCRKCANFQISITSLVIGFLAFQTPIEMVNATKGLFISCDIPMAQFIINLNASLPASQKFIIHVLDSTHMFVQSHVSEMIRSAIADFREQNSYEKPA